MLSCSILQSVVQTLLFAFSASGNGIEAGSALRLSVREAAWFVASFPSEDASPTRQCANAAPETKLPQRRPFLAHRLFLAHFYRLAASKRDAFFPLSAPLFSSSLCDAVTLHSVALKNAPYFVDFYFGRDFAKTTLAPARMLVKMRKTFILCADIPHISLFFLVFFPSSLGKISPVPDTRASLPAPTFLALQRFV
jgi:hypothetical protein